MNQSLASACLIVTTTLNDQRGNPNELVIRDLKHLVEMWAQTIREITQKKTFSFHQLDGSAVTLTLPETLAPTEYGPPAIQNAKLFKLTDKRAVYLVQKEQLRIIVPYAEADDGLYHIEEPYLED